MSRRLRSFALLAVVCSLAVACGGGGSAQMQPLTVSTVTLPDGVNNSAYSATLTSSGGTGTKTWAVTAGTLPAGLSLNGATGAITGTPTTTDTAGVQFTVTVTDTATTPAMASKQLSIRVADPVDVTSVQADLPNGGSVAAGAALNFTFTATGGIGAFTWSISAGALPAGVTLSSGGVLSGTPTASGTFNFTVQARDSATPPQTVTQAFTLTVIPQLIITAAQPLDGVTGVAYSKNIAATGGVGPNTWSITSGTPPDGLSLTNTANGTISGTPTTAGSSTFTVEVTDSGTPQQTASADITIRIGDPLDITTTALPGGITDTAYNQSLAATGGTGTINWMVQSGSLPNGFTLSPTGTISGMTGTAGTFNFTVMAVDSASPAQSDTQALSIVIAEKLSITTTALADGVVGTPYSQTLALAGGTSPFTWSTDTLPSNLGINAGTGEISGTPDTAGTTDFTATVEDSGDPQQAANKNLSIRIADPLAITTTVLPDAITDTAYDQTLAATGGIDPFTWTVDSGTLPAGITLSAGGQLSGTATGPGTFNFTVEITDSASPAQTDTQALTLKVQGPLGITTTTLPDGIVGTAYNQTVVAVGGEEPYTFSVSAGALPSNLALDANTGAITGTPDTTGTANFTITVEDSSNPLQTVNQALSIRIADPLVITTTTLPDGINGSAYDQTLAATGGTGPFTWSIDSGSLPGGLNLNGATGAITGTASAAGTFNFTAKITDSGTPAQTDTQALTIVIQTPIGITTTSPLPDGVAGVAYSETLEAAGGETPYTWSVDALPSGLSLNTSTGAITGTPDTPGTTNFEATVEDSGTPPQTASQPLSIRIAALLSITTTSLPDGQAGVAYNESLAATGGTGDITWALAMGSDPLPSGLNLSSAGVLSGTPANGGTFNFTVQASDEGSPAQTETQDLMLTIAAAPLVITTTSLPDATLNVAYSQTLAATGGTLPFTWSVTAGSLPDGLSLNSSSGAITGTPTNAATFNFTVQVEDGDANTDTQDLSITVSNVALGRNDSIATATTGLSNGTHSASISPYTDPNQVAADHDFYEFTADANAVVTIEIFAQRLGTPSRLDSVIEIVNSNGQRFGTCRDSGTVNGVDGSPDPTPNAFDDACLNDDIDLGIITDSKLEFLIPNNLGATVTFYVRVLDWDGRARPDMLYELVVSGVN